MEIFSLPSKEFKTAVLRKISEIQENIERQFSKVRKTVHEWNEKFKKEKS